MTGAEFHETKKKTNANKPLTRKLIDFIMSTYFELMKERNVSTWFAIVMIIITYIQLLGCNYCITNPDDDTYTELFEIFQIYPYIRRYKNANAYWAFQYIFFALIVIYILMLISLYYTSGNERYLLKFPVALIQNLSSFLFWIFSLPIIQFFSSVFCCVDGYHAVDTSVECWKGLHIFYFLFFTFALLLFAVVGMAISIFYRESRPDVKDGLAQLSFDTETRSFFYRILVGILASVTYDTKVDWILLAITTISSLIFAVNYFRYHCFCNVFVSIVYGISICSYLWVSLNSCIFSLAYGSEINKIILIIGILLIIPLVFNIRDRLIQKLLLEYNPKTVISEEQLVIYLSKILDIINKQTKTKGEEIILCGILNVHNEVCSKIDCPLCIVSNTDSKNNSKNIPTNSDIILHILKEIYSRHARISNFGANFHMSYSYFLFNYIGNVHLSMVELRLAEAVESSTQEQFIVYRYKRFIEIHLTKRYDKNFSDESKKYLAQSFDVSIIVDFEKVYAKLLKAMEVSANKHIEFWEQLDGVIPNLNTLHELGLEMTDSNKIVNDIWKMLLKINSNHHKALRNYGLYLKDIRNDEERGEDYINKGSVDFKNEDESITNFNTIFSENTVMIVISAGSSETQGKIISASNNVLTIFKYNPAELVGQDVNILMPTLLSSMHSEFLQTYFRTGKERVVNNETEQYAISRFKCLFCISLIVKLIPSLDEDIQYIGFIRQRKKNDNFIMTNMSGKINCISETLGNMFQLTSDFLKDNDVYVQFLSPELLSSEQSDKLANLIGYRDLTFATDEDFHAMVKQCNKSTSTSQHYSNTDMDDNQTLDPKTKEATAPSLAKNKTLKASEMEKLREVRNCKINLYQMKKLMKEKSVHTPNNKKKYTVEIQNMSFGEDKFSVKIFRLIINKDNDEKFSENLYNEFNNHKVCLSVANLPVKKKTIIEVKNRGVTQPISASLFKVVNNQNNEQKAHQDSIHEEKKEISEMSMSSSSPKNMVQSDPKFDNTMNATAIFDTKPNISNALDNSEYVSGSQIDFIPLMNDTSLFINPLPKVDSALSKLKHSLERDEEIQDLLKSSKNINGTEPHNHENKTENNATDKDKENEKEKDNHDDDISSIANRASILSKNIQTLRNSVYNKSCPKSIIRLTLVSRLSFFLFLALTLMYFLIERMPYEQVKERADNLLQAKNRFLYLSSLAGCTRLLTLLNKNNYDDGEPMIYLNLIPKTTFHFDGIEGIPITDVDSMNYQEWAYKCTEVSSKTIKDNQNKLSTTKHEFKEKYARLINPTELTVSYKQKGRMIGNFIMDCWSAIMGLVIHGLKIKDLQLENIVENESSVFYVIENSFNNLILNIAGAADAIEDDIGTTLDTNNLILLILTIIVSVVIFVVLGLVLRVTVKVAGNKDCILKLFLDIPMKEIKTQLSKCKRCCIMLRGIDKIEIQDIEVENEEEYKKEAFDLSARKTDKADVTVKETSQDEKKEEEKSIEEHTDNNTNKKLMKTKMSSKKYKAYSSYIFVNIAKFIAFVVVVEAYFLGIYLQSFYFLSNTMAFLSEMNDLSSHATYMRLMYWFAQELISTNSTAKIMNLSSEVQVVDSLFIYLGKYEATQAQHIKNKGIFTDEYNSIYETLFYNDVCSNIELTVDQYKACTDYGVLERGLDICTISCWDLIRGYVDEYMTIEAADRNIAYIRELMNNNELHEIENVGNTFFNRAYNVLLETIRSNIESRMNTQHTLILSLFIVFAVITILSYFVAWRILIKETRNSLWVTKCMLAIIPASIIMKVKSIRIFLISSSKGMMKSLNFE